MLKNVVRKYQIISKVKNIIVRMFSIVFQLSYANKWSVLVAERLSQLVESVSTNDGNILFRVSNFLLLYRAKSFYVKEPETIVWLNNMSPQDVLYDIGANIGVYSIYAGKRGVQVLSFEPVYFNFYYLNDNISLNNLNGKVIAYPIAISDSNDFGKMSLHSLQAGAAFNNFEKEGHGALTQGSISFSLDDLIEKYHFPVPTHVKIDVDGLEGKIIKGMVNTLKCSELKSVLVEINESLDSDLQIVKHLIDNGFTIEKKGEPALNFGATVRNYIFLK